MYPFLDSATLDRLLGGGDTGNIFLLNCVAAMAAGWVSHVSLRLELTKLVFQEMIYVINHVVVVDDTTTKREQ